MKYLTLFICIIYSVTVTGQTSNAETNAVKKVISTLFEGMRKGDSAMVSTAFAPAMIMQTIADKDGSVEVLKQDPAGFLKAVGTPHKEVWDERITFDEVLIDDSLASVWTSYQFYLGTKFSHCGVNSFQLVKTKGKWQIVHLIDTRRKQNCN